MASQRRPSQPSSPLSSTTLHVAITDLVAEYVVHHRFENTGDDSIEAVFSFPVPLDAAFLGMQATLAGETLIAQIQPRHLATGIYDDAIARGNSAVLFDMPEPGLLGIGLGNLKPGESGEIELRFATALRVADRAARFSLPLVHRPRYGGWALEDLETPTHDFVIEHPMSVTIRVTGLLASAPVTCATHAARFARCGDALEPGISQAMLDRDLVLAFELGRDLPPAGRLIADGETSLGTVSFVLPMRDESPKPLDLCLVLDCSGSMVGDAIEQSRRAMDAIIDAVGEQDRIQVLRFGATVVSMFRRPLLATSRVRDALGDLVQTIDADLGGTEMGKALAVALKQMGPSEPDRARAIILVTDGAVQPANLIKVQAAAKKAGVRIFVVAVGSSAGTEVLGPFAEATGAVLERAVPAEPIDAGVMRQFRRARETGTIELHVTWPSHDATPIPMGVAYPGDAISVAARLPAHIEGEVVIEAPTCCFLLRVPLGAQTTAPALRALLGQEQYRSAAKDEREVLALRYELLTIETAAVLVKLRNADDKADGLPIVVPIPQMVPEGMLLHSLSDRAYPGQRDHSPVSRKVSQSYDACYGDMSYWPGNTRAIFRALHRVLFDALLNAESLNFTLESAIAALPEEMREPARSLLKHCGLKVGGKEREGSARLLIVLNTALSMEPLSGDQEAILDRRRPKSSWDVYGRYLWSIEQSRLLDDVGRAMSL